jgi:predicted SprT family Zn-dependent metalloprotease
MKPLHSLAETQAIFRDEVFRLGAKDRGFVRLDWHRTAHILGKTWHDKRLFTLNRQSVPYQPEWIIRDLARHEMAHAIAGFGAGHGGVWQRIAIQLGCTMPSAVIAHAFPYPSPYLLWCPNPSCNYTFKRYRRHEGRLYAHKACGTLLRFDENPDYIKL